MSVIAGIVGMIATIMLVVNSHQYYLSNNIWAEESDKSAIVPIILVFLIILFFSFVIFLKIKSDKGKEVNYALVKKRRASGLGADVLELLVLGVLNEEIICELAVHHSSFDLSEAIYLAGHYAILREYLLILGVVGLIDNIIVLAIAHNHTSSNTQDKL